MRSAVRVTGGAETMVCVAETQFEVLLRMGQGVMGDQRRDVGQLSGLGAEKFAPRRGVEEQVGDGDGGSARQSSVVDVQDLAAGNLDAGSGSFSSPVAVSSVTRATEAMEGSASPRKPRVAMESRSSAVRSLEVAWRSKASRASSRFMPWPSSAMRISLRPPASTSTRMRLAPGVERVLQQLLHHRRGPVHHLAGGDLVGNLVGKNANAAHKVSRVTNVLA